jgi:NADH-quinone oxidoreductase subunit D
MREMDESAHMIRQLIDLLKATPGPDQRGRQPLHAAGQAARVHGDRVADQPLQADHGGPAGPAGDIYVAHEAANGELGFYLVSTGGGTPWKVHVRSPSFVHMGGLHRLLEGYQLADVIPTFGSVNMIGGECDR